MFFNSFPFIFLFLPCVAGGFYLLHRAGREILALDWIIASSLLFYGWGDFRNLPVLLASLLFNYAIGRLMGSSDAGGGETSPSPWRKRVFIAGITTNLLFLSYFKYLSHHLPLGISFFTLTQVMYLVDCYEGMIAPSTLREHTLFASFFPAVTMGPILRAKDVLSQFRDSATLRVTANLLAQAILLFCIGLFKKVVLADSFAVVADAGYAAAGTLSMLEGWLCSLSYCLQLYYDFSGYSDMAVASALMLGIQIPINFNSPYQARSIVDFWRRWHISLSNFITNYIYTPIIRSYKKITFEKAMLATFVSMLIAGVWHGSTVNFVIFGGLHGIGLVVNQYRKKAKKKFPDAAAWLLTMAYINVTMIFFRAPTLADAGAVLRSLVNLGSVVSTEAIKLSDKKDILILIALGVAMIFTKQNSNQLVRDFQPSWKNLGWTSLVMMISLIYLNSNKGSTFVYLEF